MPRACRAVSRLPLLARALVGAGDDVTGPTPPKSAQVPVWMSSPGTLRP